jgi:hypothetical protein
VIAQLVAQNARGMLDVLVRRIDGLTDDEMLWEPVDGCMTVRDGRMDPLPRDPHHYDGGPADPVTTIAWRLAHIAGDGLTNERNVRWLAVDDAPDRPRPWERDGVPMTAGDMVSWVAASVDWWCELLLSCSDEHLAAPIGPIGGPFGEAPRAGFALHIGNDTTHHGGEVGVLRDLWRAGLR